jgi:putative DNA primase/helicase
LNSKTKRELGQRWPGLDIRADGGYAVVIGRNRSGEYTWLRDQVPDSLSSLPENLRDFLGLLHDPDVTTGGKAKPLALATMLSCQQGDHAGCERLMSGALAEAMASGRNNGGFWLAVQLRDNGYTEVDARLVMRDYALRVPPKNAKGDREIYTVGEALASLRQAYNSRPREPWPTLARNTTRMPNRRTPSVAPTRTAIIPGTQDNEDRPNLLTGFDPEDVGNGQRIRAMYGHNLHYCYGFNKWLVWDGMRWAIDDREHVRTLAQQTMKEFALQAVHAANEALTRFAAQSRKTARITNSLREMQPHLNVDPEKLDSHPYLLNFMNGTLDIRTGILHEHSREHLITKLIRYDYNPAAQCPMFMQFIQRVMGGGSAATEAQLERAGRLVSHLQKALGYTLSGVTSEKIVFLLHGSGDNGKSTLLATFLKLLEEYAVLLQIDTLMVKQESNNTQADLADLRGARFVMTSETEEGHRLSEGKLKRITQGMGRIKAVRKYENPIEFDESHKLWVDANHLPSIRGTDNAIWNRLQPIPFEVTIPKPEQDCQLLVKLLKEAEGILAWTAVGAMRWWREGLGKPSELEQAGAAWRAESDQVGRFIQECCMVGSHCSAKAGQMYETYKTWAERSGERPERASDFRRRLVERGFCQNRTNVGNFYSGIGIAHEGPVLSKACSTVEALS